jgi:hypothetical protein
MAGSADIIQTYREMLKLDPGSRVFVLLAEELCASGEWEQAAEVCRHGLIYHPDHLRVRVLLGWALMELGDAEESERILVEALEDVRKNSIIFKLLSEFSIFSGDAANAVRYARIYEAFEAYGAAGLRPPVKSPATKKKATKSGDFKVEATAEAESAAQEPPVPETPSEMSIELQSTNQESPVPEMPSGVSIELQSAEPAQETPPKMSITDVLAELTGRIEGRFSGTAIPVEILSEEVRDFLKKELTAALQSG